MAKLGDICKIQSGGTPSRSKREYWRDGNIPWVKIGDFKGNHLNSTDEKITLEGLNNSSAKIFEKGTILYSIFATLGETTILNIEAATNQAIAGLTIIDKNININYLYHYLKSKKEYVNKIGRGVAQNNINLSILREFDVPIPSKEQQNLIVIVLDKVDYLIEMRKQQLSKLDELIKSRNVGQFEKRMVV